ncbi:hypothetical protein LA080_015815 [Diaporthe eres]|uniref:F-box domain-containing protein n=1 Tax=Diaporthe vaccinii TaxID=105482 RepID=A0ABR4EW54_9PEZI|nr:hypothetical protein LA080_015815 [Diaporthe eres]
MMSQTSQLVKLPRELLDNVTSSLPTQDFNALRLACKELETQLWEYWANCFFKKRQFMIDEFSLQTLVDISRHEALSKVMTHLVIGLDEMRNFSSQSPHLHSFVEFDRWRAADCAQKALLFGGGAADLLSQALVNLPNLKTIDIRDFNSNTRYRDAAPGKGVPQWRSYGSSNYQQWPRETPWLISLNSPTNFTDTVFLVVLTAVCRCSTTVQNLEVILRNRQIHLGDDAFSISRVPDNRLANTLRGLTKLHLDLDARGSRLSGRQYPLRMVMPGHDWFDPHTAYLRRFLALTPSVTWLRLNFTPHHGSSSITSPSKLLAWLGLRSDYAPPSDAPWREGNPAPVTLPLQRLDLGNLASTSAILRGLLNKFEDLEHISMRAVWLRDPAATSDSHPHHTDNNSDCLWARVIRKLHHTNPRLKQVELDSIFQETSGKRNAIVFRNDDKPAECAFSTKTRVIDTTTLERLAENTWTETRWYKSQRNGESMDEDSLDEDSLDEDMDDELLDTDGDEVDE